MEMKITVILSEAKDLQFRPELNSCRFFASLRMTDFLKKELQSSALRRDRRLDVCDLDHNRVWPLPVIDETLCVHGANVQTV